MTDSKYTPALDRFHWLTHDGREARLDLIEVPTVPGAFRAVIHGDAPLPAALTSLLMLLADLGQNQRSPLTSDQQAAIRRACRDVWQHGDLVADALLDWIVRAVAR